MSRRARSYAKNLASGDTPSVPVSVKVDTPIGTPCVSQTVREDLQWPANECLSLPSLESPLDGKLNSESKAEKLKIIELKTEAKTENQGMTFYTGIQHSLQSKLYVLNCPAIHRNITFNLSENWRAKISNECYIPVKNSIRMSSPCELFTYLVPGCRTCHTFYGLLLCTRLLDACSVYLLQCATRG